jgi:LacI family transcriptional regulator
MRDVAEQAGVSVTTVSHVVNNTRPVNQDKRERVLAAMHQLGYQPNKLARSLRRGKTHTVGVIVPDSANPFFAEVARGIEDTSFEHGYSVILCNTDCDLDKERLYTNLLSEKQVDGILFVAAGVSQENLNDLLPRRIPLVLIDRHVPEVAVDTVLVDNARGGWLATRHLLELGHRRIGCIMGPEDITSSNQRLDGYRQALHEHGQSPDGDLIVAGDFQFESGYRGGQALLTLPEPPSAIFASNDLMALGAARAARELGFEIPATLSLVGFDDVQLATYANPPLTSVRQPKYEMGVLATRLLFERVVDQGQPLQSHLLDTELVVRQSTAVWTGD